jgi:hypothetical protein
MKSSFGRHLLVLAESRKKMADCNRPVMNLEYHAVKFKKPSRRGLKGMFLSVAEDIAH